MKGKTTTGAPRQKPIGWPSSQKHGLVPALMRIAVVANAESEEKSPSATSAAISRDVALAGVC